MTIKAVKFGFDEEFSTDGRGSSTRRSAEAERLRQAEAEAYQRGLLDGRRDADRDASVRLAAAMERMAALAAEALARLEGERAALERQAAELAIAFACKLAGDALDLAPLAPLETAAAECFRQLVGAPHVVVRVPPDLVDRARSSLQRVAHERGFEGRIVVLGDPDHAAGDFTLEWADGGMSRSRAALDAEVRRTIERHLGTLASRSNGSE